MGWKKTLIGLPLLALGGSCQLPQSGNGNCRCELHERERGTQQVQQMQQAPQEQEQPAEPTVLQIVALKYGQAHPVAGMVERLLPRGRHQMRLVPDVRTNSVVLSGPAKEVEAAKALVLALDTQDANQRAMEEQS